MPSKQVKGKATVQDVNWRGKIIKRGVRLWYVGTDTAKDLIYGRLGVTQPGPGYMHFSRDLPPEFYTQLTAESRVPQRTSRGVEYKWVNPKRARNEVLDCTVYVVFCTHVLNLHVYTAPQWARLEQAVQPANGDLFRPDISIQRPAEGLPRIPSSSEPILPATTTPEVVPPRRAPAPPPPAPGTGWRANLARSLRQG